MTLRVLAPWWQCCSVEQRPSTGAALAVCVRKLASDAFPIQSVFSIGEKSESRNVIHDIYINSSLTVGSSGNMGRLSAAQAGFSKEILFTVLETP